MTGFNIIQLFRDTIIAAETDLSVPIMELKNSFIVICDFSVLHVSAEKQQPSTLQITQVPRQAILIQS